MMDSNISSRLAQITFFYSFAFIFKFKTVGILLFLRISRKWWKIEQTLPLPSDMKSGISHRIAPLRLLYIVILTYIFKITKYLEII